MNTQCYNLQPGQLFRLDHGSDLLRCRAINTDRETTTIAYTVHSIGFLSLFRTRPEIKLCRLSMYTIIHLS